MLAPIKEKLPNSHNPQHKSNTSWFQENGFFEWPQSKDCVCCLPPGKVWNVDKGRMFGGLSVSWNEGARLQ